MLSSKNIYYVLKFLFTFSAYINIMADLDWTPTPVGRDDVLVSSQQAWGSKHITRHLIGH